MQANNILPFSNQQNQSQIQNNIFLSNNNNNLPFLNHDNYFQGQPQTNYNNNYQNINQQYEIPYNIQN
jgi:hypothetical protein